MEDRFTEIAKHSKNIKNLYGAIEVENVGNDINV
jgi:hypothetical protein